MFEIRAARWPATSVPGRRPSGRGLHANLGRERSEVADVPGTGCRERQFDRECAAQPLWLWRSRRLRTSSMTAATSGAVKGGGLLPIGTAATTKPRRSSFTLRAGDAGACRRRLRCRSDSTISQSYLTCGKTPRGEVCMRTRAGSATQLSESPTEQGDVGALRLLGEVERLLELDGCGVLESAVRHRFADVGE